MRNIQAYSEFIRENLNINRIVKSDGSRTLEEVKAVYDFICFGVMRGSFDCSFNRKSFGPSKFENKYYYSFNRLANILESPRIIKSSFNYSDSNLIILSNSLIQVNGDYICHNNSINDNTLFKEHKRQINQISRINSYAKEQ